jgi:hypothetical protein
MAALFATSFSMLSGCAFPLMSDATCCSCGMDKDNRHRIVEAAIWAQAAKQRGE